MCARVCDRARSRVRVWKKEYTAIPVCLVRASDLCTRKSRVKAKFTATIAVSGCPRPLHPAFMSVNSTLTRTSGAALRAPCNTVQVRRGRRARDAGVVGCTGQHRRCRPRVPQALIPVCLSLASHAERSQTLLFGPNLVEITISFTL